jgi:hypothetical protein
MHNGLFVTVWSHGVLVPRSCHHPVHHPGGEASTGLISLFCCSGQSCLLVPHTPTLNMKYHQDKPIECVGEQKQDEDEGIAATAPNCTYCSQGSHA